MFKLKAFWKHGPAAVAEAVAPIEALGAPVPKPLFDPANRQYDANRQRRRRQLLKYSSPAVVPLTLLALWLTLPMPLTQIAIVNYGHNNFPAARNWLVPLTWTSPQPFIVAFNTGTVDTRLGRYAQAEAELSRALSLAPADKRCMVLQNLVIAYNQHAASVKNQGLTQKAEGFAKQVTGITTTNTKCFPNQTTTPQPEVTPPPQKDKGGGGGGGGGGGSQTLAPDLLTPAQLQLLQQKNTEAQAIQQQDSTLTDQTDPNNLTIHPW